MTEAVKEVFRAMMPAFNNMNKTVITPLLGTGHQVSTNVLNYKSNLYKMCLKNMFTYVC